MYKEYYDKLGHKSRNSQFLTGITLFYILTIVPLAFLLPGKHFLIETDDQEVRSSSPGKTRNNVGKRVKSQNKASWIPPENCRAPDGKMYCTGCEVIIDKCNICECKDNKL